MRTNRINSDTTPMRTDCVKRSDILSLEVKAIEKVLLVEVVFDQSAKMNMTFNSASTLHEFGLVGVSTLDFSGDRRRYTDDGSVHYLAEVAYVKADGYSITPSRPRTFTSVDELNRFVSSHYPEFERTTYENNPHKLSYISRRGLGSLIADCITGRSADWPVGLEHPKWALEMREWLAQK